MNAQHQLEVLLSQRFDTPDFRTIAPIYADLLLERGHPHGVLIARMLAGENVFAELARLRTRFTMLGTHAAHWARGFLRALPESIHDAALLRALAAEPAARLLPRVGVSARSFCDEVRNGLRLWPALAWLRLEHASYVPTPELNSTIAELATTFTGTLELDLNTVDCFESLGALANLRDLGARLVLRPRFALNTEQLHLARMLVPAARVWR